MKRLPLTLNFVLFSICFVFTTGTSSGVVFDFNTGLHGWVFTDLNWKWTGYNSFPVEEANVTNDSGGKYESLPCYNMSITCEEDGYVWTQSGSVAVPATTGFLSPNIVDADSTTQIYFNYRYNTTTTTGQSGIYIYSIDQKTSKSSLVWLSNKSSDWTTGTVNCTRHPCCVTYPCNISLLIAGSVGQTNAGLAAIQCLSVNDATGCVNPVCNIDFESGLDGWTVKDNGWKWSGNAQPNVTIAPNFYSENNYIWTQASVMSAPINGTRSPIYRDVNENTTFSARYYLEVEKASGSTGLYVYSSTPSSVTYTLVTILQTTGGGWRDVQFKCPSYPGCCPGGYPCDVTITLTASIGLGNGVAAVEDFNSSAQC